MNRRGFLGVLSGAVAWAKTVISSGRGMFADNSSIRAMERAIKSMASSPLTMDVFAWEKGSPFVTATVFPVRTADGTFVGNVVMYENDPRTIKFVEASK